MKSLWPAVLSVTFLGFLTVPITADDKKDDEPGFTTLFNGKDLTGWHIMNNGRFSVRDGAILLNRGAGWLRSDKQYKDFELRMDFRFLNKGADSGIFIRATKEGANWPSKNYQVQTMDNHSLGALPVKGLAQPKVKKDEAMLKKVMKHTGEWQSYVIKARGPHLEVKVNGAPITVADGLTDQAGYLGLQGEGGILEFKNLRIAELGESKEDK